MEKDNIAVVGHGGNKVSDNDGDMSGRLMLTNHTATTDMACFTCSRPILCGDRHVIVVKTFDAKGKSGISYDSCAVCAAELLARYGLDGRLKEERKGGK